MPDFIVSDHGTICTLTPCTDEAVKWLDNHIDTESCQYWGRGVVVEPRYLSDILEGIDEDGLEFQS